MNAVLRAITGPLQLLPSRGDLHCWLRRNRHDWQPSGDHAACRNCGRHGWPISYMLATMHDVFEE